MSDIKNEATSTAPCERVRMQAPIRGEASCDYVLPDYMGDVKKLLKSTASAAPCNKFVGSGEVSFLSIITYRFMYLDRDDALWEANFTSEYEHSENIGEGFIDADCSIKVSNLSIRLQGPRKISAKAALSVVTSVSDETEIPSPTLPEGAEVECAPIMIHSAEFLAGSEREYAEEIGRLSGIPCESVEIIKHSATPTVEGYEVSESGITVRGEVDTAVLLRTSEGLVRLEKNFPFENTVGTDRIANDTEKYMPTVYVTDMNVSVNNEVSDSGSTSFYTSVVLSYTLECSLRADRNNEYTVTTDAFVVGRDTKCEFESFEYGEFSGSVNDRRKISFEIPRDGTPLRELLDMDTELRSVSLTAENAAVDISLLLSCTAVFSGDTAEMCNTVKCEQEISETIKFPSVTPDSTVYGNARLGNVSLTLDAEKLYFSATLITDVGAVCKKETRLLRAAEWSEVLEGERATVRVYYPDDGETLWSIAKSHGISVSDLMKYNPDAADDAKAPIKAKKLIIVNN